MKINIDVNHTNWVPYKVVCVCQDKLCLVGFILNAYSYMHAATSWKHTCIRAKIHASIGASVYPCIHTSMHTFPYMRVMCLPWTHLQRLNRQENWSGWIYLEAAESNPNMTWNPMETTLDGQKANDVCFEECSFMKHRFSGSFEVIQVPSLSLV